MLLPWPVELLVTPTGPCVSFRRYLKLNSLEEYLSMKTWAAHRGIRSSFRTGPTEKGLWGRVECGNSLDYWWGDYVDCLDFPGWRCSSYDGAAQQQAAQQAEARQREEDARRLTNQRAAAPARAMSLSDYHRLRTRRPRG